MEIRARRIHDPPASGDGLRVLVDRLWPRGIRRADAALDAWLPEIAPSSALRRWYGHDPERWPGFRHAYRQELADRTTALDDLLSRAGAGPLTLLFAARDRERNNAVVLRDVLLERLHHTDDAAPASPTCYAADFPDYNGLDDNGSRRR